ncbi:hypothetical protein RHMOL_Rhmol11G0135100 [Rhododendron molle]|uniref:Uncharacterized protein n=1 Tax=Rhododendron molle TaxID=49168 RepID=A0ACC0LSX6_RHOML|nr:hypothetical protein RHMOL_Rhmol11G0135100 [Rhododendron molle]
MFASPQFKENISSFQKLHVEGVFYLSLSEDRKCCSVNEGSVVQGGPNAIANGNSTNVKRLRDGQLQNFPGLCDHAVWRECSMHSMAYSRDACKLIHSSCMKARELFLEDMGQRLGFYQVSTFDDE